MVSTEFKGVGLHYTAFRDAIREDSRQTTPSRGVTPRKKFAAQANVESRVNGLMTYDRKVLKFDPKVLRQKHEKILSCTGACR